MAGIDDIKGTLKIGEFHPAAHDAYAWLVSLDPLEIVKFEGAFASCAIENNRLAEVCGETLRRILNKEPVSDRYLLGLCWVMKNNLPG